MYLEGASETNDNQNLILDDAWLLDQMLVSEKMLVEFTPIGAPSQIVATLQRSATVAFMCCSASPSQTGKRQRA